MHSSVNGNWYWQCFREKELICIRDGQRLGHPVDLEFDKNGCIQAVIACAPSLKCSQLFSKPKRYRVCWRELCQIGEELLLANSYELLSQNMNKL